MSHIKKFNHALNRSYSSSAAYTLMAGYRRALNQLKPCEMKGNIAIFGAGHLNDIDLNYWFNEACHLHLFDIDEEAMIKGIHRQGYNYPVDFYPCDLTGMMDSGFFEEISILMAYRDSVGLTRYFEDYQAKIQLGLETRFDHIIISPLYTQMAITQVLTLFNEYHVPKDESIIRSLLTCCAAIIKRFNTLTLDYLEDQGSLTVISDLMEFNQEHTLYDELDGYTSNDLQRLYMSYKKKYGPGLGDFGLENIRELSQIEASRTFRLWPTPTNKKYIVGILCGRKETSL